MSKCSQQNHRELTGRFCSIHSFQLLQDFVVNPVCAGAGASPAQSHCSAEHKGEASWPRMNHSQSGHETHGVNSNEWSDFYRLLLKTLKDLNYNEKKSWSKPKQTGLGSSPLQFITGADEREAGAKQKAPARLHPPAASRNISGEESTPRVNRLQSRIFIS